MRRLTPSARSCGKVVELFKKYGTQYNLDYLLMAAQGYQESTLDQNVKSPVGAIGVMQVMPPTGKELKVGDITQIEPNIHAGVKYMRFMMDTYFKDEPMDNLNKGLMTFASYNAGPGSRATAPARSGEAGPQSQRVVRQRRARRLGADRPRDGDLRQQHLQVLHHLPPDQRADGSTRGREKGRGERQVRGIVHRSRLAPRLVSGLLLIVALVVAVEAKVKVKAEQDKTFDFRGVRTWAWHPSGSGDVKMAVTPDDNPAAVQKRFAPVIEDAITRELAGRSIGPAASPQVFVNYYVLISTNMSAQTMGQFVPTVPEWGLPPFSGATQSLRVFEQGSLLIDVTAVATRAIVWRGMAQAEIHRERTPAERDARLRAAIADLLKKLPRTT